LGAAMPLTVGPTDLAAVCQDVIAEMRAGFPDHALRFRANGDLNGKWDASRVRQVIANLVGNAIQHGEESGPTDLAASADDRHVMLSVRNGGLPMAPEALPTIFDPLTRGPASERQRERRPGSIGLGLY